MIKKPITTEKAIRLIETENIIVFEVSLKDSKETIKKEVEKTFNVKVNGINTLTRENKKIAFVKLDRKHPAIDIATKLGMI
ncbi:50S ribosomal protein L23 [Candidatus Pacearchaeota archaeon]|nr:50S ribosomal protein L23 [Candidatus Pacearchaeota archaeon]